jgi:hypothetical protein
MSMKTQDSRSSASDYIRLNLTLPDELDRMLQEFGSNARAAGGYKIPKTTIIRSLIRMLMILGVDLSDVKTEEDLLRSLLLAIGKSQRKLRCTTHHVAARDTLDGIQSIHSIAHVNIRTLP